MHPRSFPLSLIGFAIGAASGPGLAQTAPPQTVVITGNPLQADTLAQPSEVLTGEALLRRRAATLGDTLDGLPGVAGTRFGPNASRPVIRGLDGDRIRMLDNGAPAVDASSLSFDHAVAIDPLVVERIEVLRGPSALLYGGNATGGVVNTVDNRIPKARAEGLSGRAELRVGGAEAQRGAAAVLDGGAGDWAWHVDAFGRRTDDLRVPRHVPVADGDALPATGRVRNSAADSHGGAVGAGWVGSQGRFGLALDSFRNDYGVTAEPDVTIRMQRERLAAAGQWRLDGPLRELTLDAGVTDYRHQEVEGGGEIGTTFDSRGRDLRLQARHARLGPLDGVFGWQSEQLDFSALGEEAFVPATRTRSDALFVLEGWRLPALELSGGLRVERVEVVSRGDGPDDEPGRFGPALTRRFEPWSATLGAVWALTPGWQASANLGHTERAPAYHELYANGLHLATGAFERGDPTLGLERSRHAELGLRWAAGERRASLQAFVTRFSNYIALEATGADVPVEGEDGDEGSAPEYRFRGVPAQLHGVEADVGTTLHHAGWAIGLTAGADLVRGTQRDSGEPLPRLAPWRVRAGLDAAYGPWRAGLTVRHAGRQARVPATDTPTAAYTLVDVSLSLRQRLGATDALWFVRLSNLGDALAYSATTIGTLRPLVPLGGRAASAGVQLSF